MRGNSGRDLKIETPCVSNSQVNFTKNMAYFKDTYIKNNKNRRISYEIKKIFRSCHIILFILDVRNPIGTWPSFLNEKDKYKSKKILLILNKCDLVPSWITEKWITILSKYFLVFSFFCKRKNNQRRKKIIGILKKVRKKFYSEKKKICVGIVGYPNVGKSSFINTLTGKKSSKVSFIPGQTKTWQFVKLSKEIFLLDSPGIVSGEKSTKESNILKGIIRLEKIENYNTEIIDILKKIVGIVKKNKTGSKNFNFLECKELKYHDSSLGDGGYSNSSVEIVKTLNSFLLGYLPWFSPIPSAHFIRKKLSFINNWNYIDSYF